MELRGWSLDRARLVLINPEKNAINRMEIREVWIFDIDKASISAILGAGYFPSWLILNQFSGLKLKSLEGRKKTIWSATEPRGQELER